MMIQPLPTPDAADPNRPGFHLRTLKTDQGERRYTVYVPEGYDGTKTFPVILFLHGSGERGRTGSRRRRSASVPRSSIAQGGVPAHRRLPPGPADMVGRLARRRRRRSRRSTR